MTNQNKKNLSEKKSLIWFFNPLFVFFAKFCWPAHEDPSTIDNSFSFLPCMVNLEFKFYSTPVHLEKSKKMMACVINSMEYLDNPLMFLDYSTEMMPVLCMTYLYSLYLAAIPYYRNKFYEMYNGKIPAITQLLLNSIRIGSLNNDYYVSEIKFDPIMDSIQIVNSSEFTTVGYFELSPELFKRWFELVSELFSDNKLFFAHFVELKKVPMAIGSKQKLRLTSFNQQNKNFFINLNVENSQAKEKYEILNKAVNANFILSEDFHKSKFDFEYEGKVIGDDIYLDINKDKHYQFDFASQLLDGIINCNANDFL